MRRKWIFFAPLALLGILLVAFIGGSLVQWLWNAVLPDLFGWRTITFWQALGVLALCRILFGGFGRHGSGRSWRRRRHMRDRVSGRFYDRMDERWQVMTPEERERFRQRMRDRFGVGQDTDPTRKV